MPKSPEGGDLNIPAADQVAPEKESADKLLEILNFIKKGLDSTAGDKAIEAFRADPESIEAQQELLQAVNLRIIDAQVRIDSESEEIRKTGKSPTINQTILDLEEELAKFQSYRDLLLNRL